MTFRLTILGSSSALPTAGNYPSAHVLNIREQFFLIDAGEGVQMQLLRNGISLHKINHIFISHLHGDHLYGLWGVISSMGLLGRERVLTIYAPAPFGEILYNHRKYFDRNLPYKIVWREVNTKESEVLMETDVFRVSTIPLKHSVPSAGYLFAEKEPGLNVRREAVAKYGLGIADSVRAKNGEDIILENGDVIMNETITYKPYVPRSFAYCCDTAYSEKVVEAVKGVDLLYHEATFLDEDRELAKCTLHSTAGQAGKVAKKANVKKLIIGHFSVRYKGENERFLTEAKEEFENTFTAEPGKSFDVPLEKA